MRPRIAKERSDAGEPRVEKILELVASSKYSIHDLSRCQAREGGEYYRLNMPFELGLDFGCRRFGAGRLARKVILVLEQERFRYQAAISDLAGSDVEAHHGDHAVAVRKVRNWLAGIGGFERIGGARVLADYEDFQRWYLDRQRADGFSADDITDYSTPELLAAMFEWDTERQSAQRRSSGQHRFRS